MRLVWHLYPKIGLASCTRAGIGGYCATYKSPGKFVVAFPPKARKSDRTTGDKGETVVRALKAVIAGIAILFVVILVAYIFLVSSVHRWAKPGSPSEECALNLGIHLGSCLISYQDKNNGDFPPSLDVLVENGMPSTLTVCPATGRKYHYVAGLSQSDLPTSILVFEDNGNHGDMGLHVLCLHGEERISEDELRRRLKEQLAIA